MLGGGGGQTLTSKVQKIKDRVVKTILGQEEVSLSRDQIIKNNSLSSISLKPWFYLMGKQKSVGTQVKWSEISRNNMVP